MQLHAALRVAAALTRILPDKSVNHIERRIFADGYTLPDSRRIRWDSRRQRSIAVESQQIRSNTDFTLSNYASVLTGESYKVRQADGSERVEQGDDFSGAFLNSIAVTIPATVIPILIAAWAAYAFAWMRFPGRKLLFTIIVALLVVPLQIALVPILRDYVGMGLAVQICVYLCCKAPALISVPYVVCPQPPLTAWSVVARGPPSNAALTRRKRCSNIAGVYFQP